MRSATRRPRSASSPIRSGSAGLEQKPFREDWLIVVVPAAHPLASQEKVAFDSIADADFIGLTDGSALQVHLADQARALGKRIRYRVQLKSFDAICRVIASGGASASCRAMRPSARCRRWTCGSSSCPMRGAIVG